MADKVWGLNVDGRTRVIVRARSQRAAVDLLQRAGWPNLSLYYFRDYAGETGNQRELETATSPGVWRQEGPSHRHGPLVPVVVESTTTSEASGSK